MEFTENLSELLCRNTDPAIPDFNPGHPSPFPTANQDTALISVANSVRNQICNHAVQQHRIAFQPGFSAYKSYLQALLRGAEIKITINVQGDDD